MQQQQQIENIQKRIAQQQQIFQRLRMQQQKLTSYIKQFKQVLKKQVTTNEQQIKNIQNDQIDKIHQNLQKQIQSANQVLKYYRTELKHLQRRNQKIEKEDLQQLQKELKQKENQLKKVKQQIKQIEIVKRKQGKQLSKKLKNQDLGVITKLLQEIRKNKEMLERIKQKNCRKKQLLDTKNTKLQFIQNYYLLLCQEKGDNPVIFQDFKLKKKLKKQQEIHNNKIKQKKIQSTVKDIINRQINLDYVQYTEKGLKDLKIKKQVMEVSLKNAQKKYQKQINQLTKKLQFLSKDNQTLQLKLIQKTKQKQITMTQHIDMTKIPHNTAKSGRKLTPIK